MSDLWTTPVEALLEKHRWDGGYRCGCGAEMNSPQTWSRHVVEEAWEKFTLIGREMAEVTRTDDTDDTDQEEA